MHYNDWLGEIVARFQRDFDSMVVGNNLEHGPEFEKAVANGLKRLLPARCGVCVGYVVERSGKKAGDDIIIYDRTRFQTLHGLGDDLGRKDHVPFEAVLAYIEAKHTLYLDDDKHRQSLAYACGQIGKVRALTRPEVRQMPAAVMRGYTAPGFPSTLNQLYTAVIARRVQPVTSKPADLADAMRRVRDAGLGLPDLVVAGRLLSLPSNYGFVDGVAHVTGTRPFLNIANNRPIFTEGDHAFGTGLVHLMSTIEDITLGTLPWFDMIRANLSGGLVVWGPHETFKKAENPEPEKTNNDAEPEPEPEV